MNKLGLFAYIMIVHRLLAEAVVNALKKIFYEGEYANDVVEKTIRSDRRWGARDRRFVAEAIYDIVRNYRLFQYCAGNDNLWDLFAVKLWLQGSEIPQWQVFKSFDEQTVGIRFNEALKHFEIRFSLPDWLNQTGENELGVERWQCEIAAMHTEAKVCLRVNTLKTSVQDTVRLLANEGIQTIQTSNGLMLTERKNLFNTQAFKNGWLEIQDENSQMAAKILCPAPGEVVIDACAGAGGKTLHLAEMMQNQGCIYAFDVIENKLIELNKRCKRAGVNIAKSALMNERIKRRLFEKADKLLLDVPCSGMGVMRRNPDSKWKLTPTLLSDYCKIQWEILSSYHTMLKPGGTLLYVTCSILPSENEKQTEKFLSKYGDKFTLIDEKHFWPSNTGFDGFYMALYRKVTA